MGVFVDGTKSVEKHFPTNKNDVSPCHVSFGSRYQLDDAGT